jgi:argininosuccinate lyase
LGIESGRDLAQLSLTELQQLSVTIGSDVFEVLTLEGSVRARNHFGGTAPDQVRTAIKQARQRLEEVAKT